MQPHLHTLVGYRVISYTGVLRLLLHDDPQALDTCTTVI